VLVITLVTTFLPRINKKISSDQAPPSKQAIWRIPVSASKCEDAAGDVNFVRRGNASRASARGT